MPPYDALLHVMSTVSTGGFSAYSNSLGQYQDPMIAAGAAICMLLGAVGFPTYYVLYRRDFRRFRSDPQVLYLGVMVVIFFLIAAAILKKGPGAGLTSAFFHVVSALTTTGFSITPASEWPGGFQWLVIFLMTVGGCAGSTAGGLKIFRLILLIQVVKWMVLHTLLPKEAKIPIKVGALSIRSHQIKMTIGFAALYMLLVVATAFLLTVEGYRPIDALFESTSALGTVGLSAGITSPMLPAWAKCLLAANMWAGRLEILPVLVVLYPQIWLKKRSRK
jgi:trk system potassium uptake protein TrkH